MNRNKETKGTLTVKNKDADRLNRHVLHRIFRLANALVQISAGPIKERWGLRPTDLRLLNVLDGEKPLAVREISRRTHVDQAWVSRSLRDLESRDLVQRQDDPMDSRLSLISLTQHGRKLLDEVRPYAMQSEKLLLNGIDEMIFRAHLDQMEKNAEGMLDTLNNTIGKGRKK